MFVYCKGTKKNVEEYVTILEAGTGDPLNPLSDDDLNNYDDLL
jgi:hypothetical protein